MAGLRNISDIVQYHHSGKYCAIELRNSHSLGYCPIPLYLSIVRYVGLRNPPVVLHSHMDVYFVLDAFCVP